MIDDMIEFISDCLSKLTVKGLDDILLVYHVNDNDNKDQNLQIVLSNDHRVEVV